MSIEQSSGGDEVPAESGVIAVHVRDLGQLFNSMDPSPFHEKELDDDAEQFIVESAKELDAKAPVAVVVYLSAPVGLPNEGRVLGDAIRIHFARQAERLHRQQRRLLRRGWMNLVIGLALLISSVVLGEWLARRNHQGPLVTVIRESLLIGGWVAMSRPIEILLYDWWSLRNERRMYERLGRIPVRIVYSARPAHDVATTVNARAATTSAALAQEKNDERDRSTYAVVH